LKQRLRIKWPAPDNANGWKCLCLSNCLTEVSPSLDHPGTPPSLSLLLSMSERQVNQLFEYLIECFLEEGYCKALCQWLYAVLAVLQKPLLPDLCSAMRDLAKQCRQLRSTLCPDSQKEMISELSLFIVIASVYFEQKDLSD